MSLTIQGQEEHGHGRELPRHGRRAWLSTAEPSELQEWSLFQSSAQNSRNIKLPVLCPLVAETLTSLT